MPKTIVVKKTTAGEGESEIGTSVPIPNYIRSRLYSEAAKRTLAGILGSGRAQETSANHVLVEDIAARVGYTLPTEEWTQPDHDEVTMLLVRMPSALNDAVTAFKAQSGKSIRAIAMDAIDEGVKREKDRHGIRGSKIYSARISATDGESVVATTIRVPNNYRTKLYECAASRVLAGELGKGSKQEPSANQILIEFIAAYVGHELETEEWEMAAPLDTIVWRMRLPPELHRAMMAYKDANGISVNNIVWEAEEDAIRRDREKK